MKENKMKERNIEFYKEYSGRVVIHTDIFLEERARFAMDLITRGGMFTGTPDGEDSAGRAKLKLLEPEPAVKRACEIANILFDEFVARGWIKEVPSLKTMPKFRDQS